MNVILESSHKNGINFVTEFKKLANLSGVHDCMNE